MTWAGFWEWLHLQIINQAAKFGLGGRGVTVTVELGSGYSVNMEQESNREKLDAGCVKIASDTIYQPKDGKTFCNFGFIDYCALRDLDVVADLCKVLKIDRKKFTPSAPPMANQFCDYLAKAPGWRREEDVDHVIEHVTKGGLAAACRPNRQGHGHVAGVAPRPKLFSGSLNQYVPILCNVGEKCGLLKSSECFAVEDGMPVIYLYGEV